LGIWDVNAKVTRTETQTTRFRCSVTSFASQFKVCWRRDTSVYAC
jgi:hypothetical protein